MVQKAVLERTASKLTNYIEKYVTLAGTEKREEVMGLFDRTQLLFPHWGIMTCPIMHPELYYISQSCPFVFGYSHQYLINNSRMEKYFTHIHEDDQQDLYDCFAYLHDFLEKTPPDEHPIHRAVFTYRLRKANGQYMHLHDEKASLYLPGSGNLYYSLFQDITERPFTGVKIELFRQSNQSRKIEEFRPASRRTLLSKREQELVTLIRQGLSTKEIAGSLHISHHTVRNIKSKLFQKYNVNNSIELLNMAG